MTQSITDQVLPTATRLQYESDSPLYEKAAKFTAGRLVETVRIVSSLIEQVVVRTLYTLTYPTRWIAPKVHASMNERLNATNLTLKAGFKQFTTPTKEKAPLEPEKGPLSIREKAEQFTAKHPKKAIIATALLAGLVIAAYYYGPSLFANPTPPTPPTPPPATPTGGTPLETCEVPNPFNSIFNPPTSKGLPNETPSFPAQRETPLISDNLAAQLNNSFTTSLANHSGTATQIPTSTALPTINKDLFTPSLNSSTTTCPANHSGTATQIPTSTTLPTINKDLFTSLNSSTTTCPATRSGTLAPITMTTQSPIHTSPSLVEGHQQGSIATQMLRSSYLQQGANRFTSTTLLNPLENSPRSTLLEQMLSPQHPISPASELPDPQASPATENFFSSIYRWLTGNSQSNGLTSTSKPALAGSAANQLTSNTAPAGELTADLAGRVSSTEGVAASPLNQFVLDPLDQAAKELNKQEIDRAAFLSKFGADCIGNVQVGSTSTKSGICISKGASTAASATSHAGLPSTDDATPSIINGLDSASPSQIQKALQQSHEAGLYVCATPECQTEDPTGVAEVIKKLGLGANKGSTPPEQTLTAATGGLVQSSTIQQTSTPPEVSTSYVRNGQTCDLQAKSINDGAFAFQETCRTTGATQHELPQGQRPPAIDAGNAGTPHAGVVPIKV